MESTLNDDEVQEIEERVEALARSDAMTRERVQQFAHLHLKQKDEDSG